METDSNMNLMSKCVEPSRVFIDNFTITAFEMARLWGEQVRLYTLYNLLFNARKI